MKPLNIDVSAVAPTLSCDAESTAHFVLLHADPQLSLATDRLLLPPEQAPAFDNAMTLAEALTRLHDDEAARIQAAVQAGHAAGLAEGRAQGRLEAEQHAAVQLAATTRRLTARADAELRALAQQVVPLAVMVVRRVAAGLAPESVLAALARHALQHLAGGPGVAPPADGPHAAWQNCQLRLPAGLLPQVQAHLGDTPGLRLVPDDNLAELDCVLDTPSGRLLAGLETQLGRVQARLMQAETGHAAAAP